MPSANEFVNLTELHRLAVDIAREAGVIQTSRLHLERTIDTKSTSTDAVTEVDRACEDLIVRRILEARPDDSILGEEGASRQGTSSLRWVIDPLDGTVNYVYRRGDFAVSLGIEMDLGSGAAPVVGVVHDPSLDETFSAIRSRPPIPTVDGKRAPISTFADGLEDAVGAWLNGERIHVNAVADLGQSLVGTGFGYDPEVRRAQGAMLAQIVPHVRDIRRAGSAALDLCAVACGRLDGYFERGLQPWDSAAAALIVEEAGGIAERLDSPEVPAGTWVVAGPGIFEALRTRVVAASQP
ncbi:MAG: inositol monophosphatase [Dehalococcoidia bacterium]|nr:inositol monophosphatase [Dehalococcoidia bacterium]